MPKKLKLVNTENTDLLVKPLKASDCEIDYCREDLQACPAASLDYCAYTDKATCTNHSQDYCSGAVDYFACSGAQVDTCGIDTHPCPETTKYDITD